jgi:hypothetical protein
VILIEIHIVGATESKHKILPADEFLKYPPAAEEIFPFKIV